MRSVLGTLICLLTVTNAAAQAAPSIEGVWKIVQRITPAGNVRAGGVAVTQDQPAPTVLIFTKRGICGGVQPTLSAALASGSLNRRSHVNPKRSKNSRHPPGAATYS